MSSRHKKDATVEADLVNVRQKNDIRLWPVVVIPLLVILIMAMMGTGAYLLLDKWEDRGSFGDMFGAANTLFAGLAFAGLIYTILLQRGELRLQRLELQLTREELSKSAQAQQNSEKALTAQVTLLNEQITILRKTLNEQASASVGERQMQADKIFVEQPRLRCFFLENVAITKEHPDYQAALAIAQYLANYFDTFFLLKNNYDQMYSENEWLSYINTHVSMSPILRQFIRDNSGWFTKELTNLCHEKVEIMN